MEYVTLSNGMKMPKVGFGVFQVKDPEECVRVVKDAIKVGYRLLDTAQSYGNEAELGKSVNESINEGIVTREELFITTKLWISNITYEKAKSSMYESLDKMGLEYVDLVLLHQPLNDVYGALRGLKELVDEGKVKAVGVSNFYADRIVDIAHFAAVAPVVNQIEVNPFNARFDQEEWNQKFNIQLEAWAPFAEGKQGIFTNPVLKEIGDQYGKSVGQVILRWLVQRNIIPLSKTVKKSRMEENINVFDFELSADDMAKITQLNKDKTSFFDHEDPKSVEMLVGLVR